MIYYKKRKDRMIAVAMSGGFDSTATLILLKQQGFKNLIGVSIKYLDSKFSNSCCEVEDIMRAKIVCSRLNIPHYTFNLKEEFFRFVLKPFMTKWISDGETPVACTDCNSIIRFSYLFKEVEKLGVEFIATGHYAILRNNLLYMSKDKSRDQTYFLSFILVNKLKKLLFPLGRYLKKDLIKSSLFFNFKDLFYDKKESRGLCFLNKNKKNFIDSYLNFNSETIINGDIFDDKNNKLGVYFGWHNYTIGQSKNLNLSKKYYVLKKDLKNKRLIVTDQIDKLYCNTVKFILKNCFIEDFKGVFFVKISKNSSFVVSKVVLITNLKYKVIALKKEFSSVAAGQIIVGYLKDKFGFFLVFSGIIIL